MAYITTPDLGLELADPTTIQAFETTNVNSNFLLLEAGIVADRVRLTASETAISTLNGKPSFNSQVTNFEVTTPAALDAVATAAVGDTAAMTTPGTGIDPFTWFANTGSGATIDWQPSTTIYASSKANMDAFIAVVAAITDLRFRVGEQWVDNGTGARYKFTSTAGAYIPFELACSLRRSSNYNLTTSAVALTWDVEISDPAGMHDNGSNTSRLVAVEAGLYEVCASLYNSNTSGMGTVYGRLNGTTDIPGSLDRRTADATAALPLHTVFSLALAAGDYVEIMVLHASAAGTIAGGTIQGSAVVSMKRVGP